MLDAAQAVRNWLTDPGMETGNFPVRTIRGNASIITNDFPAARAPPDSPTPRFGRADQRHHRQRRESPCLGQIAPESANDRGGVRIKAWIPAYR